MNFKVVTASLIAALAIAGIATDKAAATTYNFDFTYNPATPTCSTNGDFRTCYEYQLLPADTYGDANDVFNIDVGITAGARLDIPGSKSENLLFVELYDDQYLSGGTQTDTALGVITAQNYVSSVAPVPLGSPSFPLTSSDNYIYQSIFGFCCRYGVPNSGFSFTGADATLTLQNSDPNALSYIIVGTYVEVPEAASWSIMLIGVFGVGGALRGRRAMRAVRPVRAPGRV